MLLLSSADFFQYKIFLYKIKKDPVPINFKILSGTLSECQTVWIQIRTNILSLLIWVQTVCKCYQKTTKAAAVNERVIVYSCISNYAQSLYGEFLL